MSRPKPNILLERTNKVNYRVEQILDAEAVWIVVYKNKPFNLRSGHSLLSHPGQNIKKQVLLILDMLIILPKN